MAKLIGTKHNVLCDLMNVAFEDHDESLTNHQEHQSRPHHPSPLHHVFRAEVYV